MIQNGLKCVDSVVLGQHTAGQVGPSAGVQEQLAGRVEREKHDEQMGLIVGHILRCVRVSCRDPCSCALLGAGTALGQVYIHTPLQHITPYNNHNHLLVYIVLWPYVAAPPEIVLE